MLLNLHRSLLAKIPDRFFRPPSSEESPIHDLKSPDKAFSAHIDLASFVEEFYSHEPLVMEESIPRMGSIRGSLLIEEGILRLQDILVLFARRYLLSGVNASIYIEESLDACFHILVGSYEKLLLEIGRSVEVDSSSTQAMVNGISPEWFSQVYPRWSASFKGGLYLRRPSTLNLSLVLDELNSEDSSWVDTVLLCAAEVG